MKKQLMIVGITLVLLAVGFSGCTSSSKDKLIGTWKIENKRGGIEELIFCNNGSVRFTITKALLPENFWSNYRITDDTIIIETYNSYKFKFSDGDQKLILDETYIYQRQ